MKPRLLITILVTLITAFVVWVGQATAQEPGTTERVSVAPDGIQGNHSSYNPVISDNGRFVAFSSYATNLVANDTNNQEDTFVYDRQTRQTRAYRVGDIGVAKKGVVAS